MISANEPFLGGALDATALAGDGPLLDDRTGALGLVILCVPFVGFRAEDTVDLTPFPFVDCVEFGRSSGRVGWIGRETVGEFIRGALEAIWSCSSAFRLGAGSPPPMEARRSPI